MDDAPDVDALAEIGQDLIDRIFGGASAGEVDALVEKGAPLWYQAEDGTSALHAAAYREDAALVRLLIEKGAVWNAVDNLGNCPADVALSLNDAVSYEVIRGAGIRTELLLALLSKKSATFDTPSALVLQNTDLSAAGSTDAFLSSRLRFVKDAYGQDICEVEADGEPVGVMMGWEREIMQTTVQRMCDDHPSLPEGLKVLNVGFGLGIIDTYFQSLSTPPAQHVIIEPHPDVLQHMRDTGWFSRPNVKILEGKWQDFMDSEELLAVGGFDVVYTDTFSENYLDLKAFFDYLPDLLAGSDASFSFFNGLGATNATFYDVYTHLSELHLAEVGVDVEWSDVLVRFEGEDGRRWGNTRQYFTAPIYRLPVGRMRTS